ncbi:MAG: hypothetical protein A2Y61_05785 [Chloroflexi bacterium RBG_13_60_13]|nr:MAG: hypothetical protein A2Y61_05785 [Chloroflexi bacterium RBG_13_60_13]
MSEAGLAAGGVDSGDDAGVAGEPAGCVEAIDRADLAFDDDGEDVANSGKALEQLDGGGQGDSLPDALLELSDLVLEGIQSFELLGGAALRLRREV